jgi:hypothetical protein
MRAHALLFLAGLASAACGDASTGKPAAASAEPAVPSAALPEVKAASFSAKIEAASAKAGEASHAVVTVTPSAGYKINQEYPYKFKADAAASTGVTFASEVVTDVERTKERATMKIPFTAAKAGDAKVVGTVALSVCTDENCVIEKVALAAPVKVE